MRILVTGGTGVVGVSTVSALLRKGHQVRLLSRHAGDDSQQWPEGVEPWPGNVADAGSIEGSALGCDAILHLVAIVDESPPEATFESVNVQGTSNIVAEAGRSGVQRFVYVSSLGAERGQSPYHKSKLRGEEITRTFSGDWLIVRPGNVYGPGDEQMSLLLTMVRTLPAVPMIGDGEQQFQPIWHEDLAEALALAVERTDLVGVALDVAGTELTSQRDLMERFQRLTDRAPVSVPLPDFLANLGVRFAEAVGADLPFNESQMQMLTEGNLISDSSDNALTTVFGVKPTPLSRGLELLADSQDVVLPEEGVGALERKRFWADIEGSRLDPDELIEHVRTHFPHLTPSMLEVGAEPGTPDVLELGETITLSLPIRGHIQVRVAEMRDRHITLLTVRGHPLASAARFIASYEGHSVRFEVQVYERAANVLDMMMMRTIGGMLQNRTWEAMVSHVVEVSGGEASDGVQRETATLAGDEARSVERWARELAMSLKREENRTASSGGSSASSSAAGRPDADLR